MPRPSPDPLPSLDGARPPVRGALLRWAGLLVVLTTLVYSAVFAFDFVNYDDPRFVVGSPQLQDGLTVQSVRWALEANLMYGSRDAEYWQPVTSFSRLVDHALFGRAAAGHHAQSLLIHLANVLLVFWLVYRLGGSPGFAGAFALIFALHPLNVEVVAWMAARKDLLCGFGSLLTLLAYLRFTTKPGVGRFTLALAAYLVALAAKPSAIALPLALVLLDVWPLARLGRTWTEFREGTSRRVATILLEKVPFGLMSVAVAGITFISQKEVGGVSTPAKPLVVRLGEAAIGYADYLRLFFWPRGLCALYFADPAAPDRWMAISAMCLLLGVSLVALAWSRREIGVLVGWLWFLGLLFPLMGLVPFGRQSVADRYMYLPQLGLITMVLLAGAAALRRVPSVYGRVVRNAALVVLAAVLGWLTYRQSLTWRNSETLWAQALLVDPTGTVANVNYADPLDRAGRWREAEFHLRVANKRQPESTELRQSLGIFLVNHHRYAEAVPLLERLVADDPFNMKTHATLIQALERSGRAAEARRAQARQEAIRGRVFVMVGTSLLESGEWDAATEQFRSAWSAADGVEIGMQKRIELAKAADWQARASGAVAKAKAPPRHLLNGLVLGLQNRWAEAEAAFAAAVQDNERDAEARWRRAVCLRRLGRIEEAEREFAVAAASEPKDAAMQKAWTAAGGK